MAHFPISITPSFNIDTEWLDLAIITAPIRQATLKHHKGYCRIYLPENFCSTHPHYKEWLYYVITNELRIQARQILVPRLQNFAAQHHITIQRITIKDMTTRWGSCSSLGNINLNLWLLLLPPHLIDYVLLHELAHRLEMNHSEKFWKQLNKMTTSDARLLRKQLRNYEQTQLRKR